MKFRTQARSRQGFTLIELLIVIGIIVMLLAILLPAVNHVRMQAYNANTQNEMSRIVAACQMYYHDFNSYPGPVANAYLAGGAKQGPPPIAISGLTGSSAITSSENLVLGLFGFLNPPTSSSTTITYVYSASPAQVTTPTHDVLSLNPLHPASYHYMDYNATELTSTTGLAGQDITTYAGQTIPDTNVPEFIDGYPDPLPIIYVRANVGNGPSSGSSNPPNWVSANDLTQYNTNELDGQGGTGIYGSPMRTTGGGQFIMFCTNSFTTLDNAYTGQTLADDVAIPYAGWWPPTTTSMTNPLYYFMNPNILNGVRGKDGFVLISAGLDRTYGTLDDLIVTP